MGRFLLGCAIVLVLASTAACGSEPLDVAPNVDLGRFQGKWYEIARLPRAAQTDCHGTTAFYTQGTDGTLQLINQCNTGQADGPLHTVAMAASVPDRSVPAKLALDVGGYKGDYWILEVGPSYEYAVVGHPSRLYFWILSRAPTLDPETTKGILARAGSAHFDLTQLQYTPQPPSGERVSSAGPVGPVPPAVSTGCSVSRVPAVVTDEWAWRAWLPIVAASLAARRRHSPCRRRRRNLSDLRAAEQ
jgi:apolipoprotein D and lipocalin family protein